MPTEAEVLEGLMRQARVATCYLADLTRNSCGTVLDLMAFGSAKLSREPPDADVLHLLLKACSDNSALAGTEKMPRRYEPGTTNPTPAAEAAAYATLHASMITLCRVAKRVQLAALDRLANAATSATPGSDSKKDDEELRNAAAIAERLNSIASQVYGTRFGVARSERSTSAEQLVRTHQAFRRNTVSISPLNSRHYGEQGAIEKATKPLTLSADGRLQSVTEEEEVTKYAAALMRINAVVDSFVVAGLMAVDAAVSPQAGGYGKLPPGRPSIGSPAFDWNVQVHARTPKRTHLHLDTCLHPRMRRYSSARRPGWRSRPATSSWP